LVVELTFGTGSFLVNGVLGTFVGVTPDAIEKGCVSSADSVITIFELK